MDLAAIGLLSLAGYELASRKNKTQPQPPVEDAKPAFHDGSDAHTNMNAYYSGSQAPGDSGYTNKLSIHTGSNLMEHGSKHCRPEPTNMFNPVHDLGFVNGAPNANMHDRYDVSNKMNNVLPFEQKRVGKGLNVKGDVDVKGGFHQFFRVMPGNVNGYKKNNLPQRIVPGKQTVVSREKTPEVEAPKHDRFYELKERPLEHKKFQTHAQTKRPATNHKHDNEIVNEIYFGTAHRNDNYTTQDGHFTRHNDTTLLQEQHTNLVGQHHKVNNVAGVIVSDTDRESSGYDASNVVGKKMTYARDSDGVEQFSSTNRDISGTNKHVFNATHVDASKGYLKQTQSAIPTHRNDTSMAYEGVAHGVQKYTASREYSANDTQRQYTNAASMGHAKYFTNNAERSPGQEQYTMKEDTIVGYSPGPQGINKLSDPYKTSVDLKSDFRSDTRVNVPMVKENTSSKRHIGVVEHEQKVKEENPRMFLSVASVVMSDNPFAVKIN